MIPFQADALDQLGQLLSAHADWWQPSVFGQTPAWAQRQEALTTALQALSESDLRQLEYDPSAAALWLAQWLPALDDMDALVAQVERSELAPALELPESEGRDIKGRKWQQILYFAGLHKPPPRPSTTLLEWCAGKAHLGRLLARRQNRPLLAVEWQAALCEQARYHAQRDGVCIKTRHANVLTEPTPPLLSGAGEVLALHACGDLHRRLLRGLPEAPEVRRLSLAPCCYHLTRQAQYQPMSERAARHAPTLSRQQLHLVTQQAVVAGDTKLGRTRQLMTWRLAFNALQKDWRATEQSLSTPSRPLRVLKDGFPAFVSDMAQHHGIDVPDRVDFQWGLEQGKMSLDQSRRLALVRHRFRRALEVWLLLDRAAHLQEQGFEVRVGRFCPFHITPRNLIIQANRPGD